MENSSPDLAQLMHHLQGSSSSQASLPESTSTSTSGLLPNGKKTKGRVKIKMEYIGNKLRRYTTFSKRKTGIMKKAYELSTLTGTQVMLLVASETGHVYTYATKKLQPMISSDTGKALIQTCLNAPGDGSDLQPNRTEFTFETGTAPPNPRKRRVADTPDTAQFVSLLPTMVPTALFSSFSEEDYNQEDSGDDSDSEEPIETKEETPVVEEKKNEQAELAASLQQTLKEALKAAGNNRLMQQKRRQASPPQPVPRSQPPTTNTNAFLAPFLLSGLTANCSTNGTIFQLPQGCVYTNSPNSADGGASANSLLINSAKGDETTQPTNPLLSFPFQFNFQQLMESAALGAQITNND
ncbi:hypothetical protein KIN20_020529 [Parelaphostrongylus tenuis]|uniref:Serum response factor homolog n=1 Tax=Parelaphostrongylus tenuis TaxID=148309 RepID=A0AAD5N486_PARTN|nr:hypothetical protein KIN20_020529 [Parelaphostrongylus tenuis]